MLELFSMIHKSRFSFFLYTVLNWTWCVSYFSAHVARATPLKAVQKITIIPNTMILSGDAATSKNTLGYCTEKWLSNMPHGSVILGVNPTSCEPADWKGGTAKAKIFLPDVYSPTIYALKISWPDCEGKGLHSPKPQQTATIMLNGQKIWSKKTSIQSTFSNYYAAEHEPIVTTFVITKSDTHTLVFSVPEHTAWDLGTIELIPYRYPQIMKGIGYSPYRDCQYPGGEFQPSDDEIAQDLVRLFHTCTAIRTYGVTGVNGRIPAIAKKIGLQVFAGAWIDGDGDETNNEDEEKDEQEIQELIRLANTIDLDGVIVGNEYYLRHKSPDGTASGTYTAIIRGDTPKEIDYLLHRITQVKEGIHNRNIPVTTAELAGFMFDWKEHYEPEINPVYKRILDEIDFLLVHIYPFWDGLPIDGAASTTIKKYKAIQALIEKKYPGQNKRLIIGETGWPSCGEPRGAAVPSLENQRRYLLEFLSMAERENVEYMYFNAFDELWKIEEPGGVGQNWGYSYTDRASKHNFYGVLLPYEQVSVINLISKDLYASCRTESSNNVFCVYSEWPAGKDNFYLSGWMGDTLNIEIFECDRSDSHSGEMAIRISCSLTGEKRWCGVYWLANDSWEGPGINIYEKLQISESTPVFLTFWARGEVGGERVQFSAGGVGIGNDSIKFRKSTDWISLDTNWRPYMIDLSDQDLSNVVGGFCWVTNKVQNRGREGIRFYLDNICYRVR